MFTTATKVPYCLIEVGNIYFIPKFRPEWFQLLSKPIASNAVLQYRVFIDLLHTIKRAINGLLKEVIHVAKLDDAGTEGELVFCDLIVAALVYSYIFWLSLV